MNRPNNFRSAFSNSSKSSHYYMLQVKEKKYETVGTTSQMLASTMRVMAASSVTLQPLRNPTKTTSFMSNLTGATRKGIQTSKSTATLNGAQTAAASNSASSRLAVPSENTSKRRHSTDASLASSNRLLKPDAIIAGEVVTSSPETASEAVAARAVASEALAARAVAAKKATVLLKPQNVSNNHVTYSIDSQPKHLIKGSPL
jgi:hypothetical protein